MEFKAFSLKFNLELWLKRYFCLALVGLALVLISGCGYTLQHRLTDSFQNKKGIYVPVFANQSDEIGAEKVFTNAVIRELQSRGEVVVTTRTPGAYELRGTVDHITYSVTAQTEPRFGGLQSYRRLPTDILLSAQVSLSLVDPNNGNVLWNGAFNSFRRLAAPTNRTYNFESPSSLGLFTQSLIESRYVDIARDITRDMYDSMVEHF